MVNDFSVINHAIDQLQYFSDHATAIFTIRLGNFASMCTISRSYAANRLFIQRRTKQMPASHKPLEHHSFLNAESSKAR